ncbi:unnamed protein product [Gordionus sp. m RMFG-2023]
MMAVKDIANNIPDSFLFQFSKFGRSMPAYFNRVEHFFKNNKCLQSHEFAAPLANLLDEDNDKHQRQLRVNNQFAKNHSINWLSIKDI